MERGEEGKDHFPHITAHVGKADFTEAAKHLLCLPTSAFLEKKYM